ncbi:MAG: fibronectin type III domain-containing protein [Steroidobacteraceae bacterium]
MQTTQLATVLGSLILASMLTACGSGGEGSAAPSAAVEPVVAAPVGGGNPAPVQTPVTATTQAPAVTPVVQTPVTTPVVTPAPAAKPTTGSATLSWTPPTQNTDGSSLANLAGYRIYYGTKADALNQQIQVTNPGLTAYTVSNLDAGTYYFAVAAYTADGVEGAPSSVGSKKM